MAKTPLKFVKFHIGVLSLRVLDLRTAQVHVTIKDVQIDFELQNETFAGKFAAQSSSRQCQTLHELTLSTRLAQGNFSQIAQPKNDKSAKYANANKQKELFVSQASPSTCWSSHSFASIVVAGGHARVESVDEFGVQH